MLPIAHIRNSIFKITQAQFAQIAGASQATVSRWENGELMPNSANLDRIRQAAKANNIAWNDTWFFVTPEPEPEPVS
jgi:transcriptional regulator with XRE-family HTH domain